MISEALETLIELAKESSEHSNRPPEVVELFGATYELSRDGHTLVSQPIPEVVPMHSLDSLLAYARGELDPTEGTAMLIENARSVSLIGRALPTGQRPTLARATPPVHDPVKNFVNGYLPHEDFMITAQSIFAKTTERDQLLLDLGTIVGSGVKTSNDDGVSQEFTARQGVNAGTAKIENPIHLVPLRSFSEVELEPVPFVLRLKAPPEDKPHDKPKVGLFEADGGAWIRDAMAKIRDYLSSNAHDGAVILG